MIWFFMMYLGLGAWMLWIAFIIFLAIFNIQCGMREHFITLLLYIFDRCRTKVVQIENKVYTRDDSHHNLIEEEPLIDRQFVTLPSGRVSAYGHRPSVTEREITKSHTFELLDVGFFCQGAIEAIVQDDVTERFQAEELASWNLLTRTKVAPQFITWRMTLVWTVGWIVRYLILFPFRMTLFITSLLVMVCGNFVIGLCIPPNMERLRRFTYEFVNKAACRILMRSCSAVVHFHNRQYKAKGGGICVANHTSPIDTFLLGMDNVYALVGQQQGGLFGLVQWAFNRAESHVWFQRSEASDRHAVGRRLREHVQDSNKLPILIFPEGTCINNTSIMMFKKGSFETGGVIYPTAIKYDARFGDAFWNSSKYDLSTYLMMLMTSWALVADVWYLPPEKLKEGENSIEFASRVKATIAAQGGLVDLDWDGGLKRAKPRPSIKPKLQAMYGKRIGSESPELNRRKLDQNEDQTKNENQTKNED